MVHWAGGGRCVMTWPHKCTHEKSLSISLMAAWTWTMLDVCMVGHPLAYLQMKGVCHRYHVHQWQNIRPRYKLARSATWSVWTGRFGRLQQVWHDQSRACQFSVTSKQCTVALQGVAKNSSSHGDGQECHSVILSPFLDTTEFECCGNGWTDGRKLVGVDVTGDSDRWDTISSIEVKSGY